MRTREFLLVFLLIDVVLINVALLISGDQRIVLWPPTVIQHVLTYSWIVTYLIFIDGLQYLKANLQVLIKTLLIRFVVFISISSIALIVVAPEYLTIGTYLGPLAVFMSAKLVLSLVLFRTMSLRNVALKHVLIIGDTWVGNQVFKYCQEKVHLGFVPIGVLSTKMNKPGNHVIGTIADFQDIYDRHPFSAVIVALPFEEYSVVKEVISVAERNGVRIRFIPNWYSMINRNFVVSNLGNIPMLDIRNVPLYQYENRFWKRAFDLLLSTLMLIMLSPLMVLVAALIKLESRGPIFYRPVRLGVNGVPFTMFKFRSMVQSDDAVSGVQSTVKDDVRITKLGRFIRKTNIDELPQLFNVIRNEMSLVGPRPHRVYLNRDLQQKMRHYMVRHLVKPGITGWAQVNGWRGPTENRLQYMGRTLHDLWYIENWTFWLDLYILFLTIFGRKARKNAF